MFSHWGLMLIFGHWLDCVLDGFSLQKMTSPFFGPFPCSVLSNLKSDLNLAKQIDYGTQKTT